MNCKNRTKDCDNATICPCLKYEKCEYYCHSCYMDYVTEDEQGLYYHHCRMKERLGE